MIDVYIHVVNLDAFCYDNRTEGVWLPLPFSHKQLSDTYRCVTGSIDNSSVCIKEIEAGKLDVIIDPFANIFELNKIAKRISMLSKHDYTKLAAIVEMNNKIKRRGAQNFSDIQEELAVIDKYSLLVDVHNEKGLLNKGFPKHDKQNVYYTSHGAVVKKR